MPRFVFLMFVMAAFSQFWCVDCNCSHVGCCFLDVLVLERSNAGLDRVFFLFELLVSCCSRCCQPYS
uniref:Secreted protein n=1 Tax=Anguilla anguilla TaxID=7936 RepID=A0A0E9RF91_ANGAN